MRSISNLIRAIANLAGSINNLANLVDAFTGRLRMQLALDEAATVLGHQSAGDNLSLDDSSNSDSTAPGGAVGNADGTAKGRKSRVGT